LVNVPKKVIAFDKPTIGDSSIFIAENISGKKYPVAIHLGCIFSITKTIFAATN
jgi:hypothetical protein